MLKWGFTALIASAALPLWTSHTLAATLSPVQEALPQASKTDFAPYTGQITKTQVRIRLEPDLSSPILDEFNQGDMVVVLGEEEGFYAIKPPLDAKGFVFRTYVLDGVIEGNRVNVRLEPHLDSPVIAQLNTGDSINGQISALNSKWLEINLPEAVRFYVATDFIERVGDADMMNRLEKRRKEATQQVNATYVRFQQELSKPFDEIRMEAALNGFENIITEYHDVPEEQERARYFMRMAQDAYLRRKVDQLQAQAAAASESWKKRCEELAHRLSDHGEEIDSIERDLCAQAPEFAKTITPEELEVEALFALQPLSRRDIALVEQEDELPRAEKAPTEKPASTQSMLAWIPHETTAYKLWSRKHPNQTIDDFYAEQQHHSLQMRGRVQPYKRNVPNKPGNFFLFDENDNLPIGYLYSTRVNLNQYIGKPITLQVTSRPSNNFALPAYYVLQAREDDQEAARFTTSK